MSKLEFLDPFIIQSGFEEKEFGPGGQVIQSYPKEYMDLKMRVSFGKGVPARVTWISFFSTRDADHGGFLSSLFIV